MNSSQEQDQQNQEGQQSPPSLPHAHPPATHQQRQSQVQPRRQAQDSPKASPLQNLLYFVDTASADTATTPLVLKTAKTYFQPLGASIEDWRKVALYAERRVSYWTLEQERLLERLADIPERFGGVVEATDDMSEERMRKSQQVRQSSDYEKWVETAGLEELITRVLGHIALREELKATVARLETVLMTRRDNAHDAGWYVKNLRERK